MKTAKYLRDTAGKKGIEINYYFYNNTAESCYKRDDRNSHGNP